MRFNYMVLILWSSIDLMIDQALEDENADLFCLQTSVSQVIVFIVNFKVFAADVIFIIFTIILGADWVKVLDLGPCPLRDTLQVTQWHYSFV